MHMLKASYLLMVIAITLAGCSSDPPKISPLARSFDIGAAEALVAESRLPAFLFAANEHRYALYGLNDDGGDAKAPNGKSMLFFEDGRLIGRLAPEPALHHVSCLAQPGGRQLLSTQLKALSVGEPGPLGAIAPLTTVTAGDLLCPQQQAAKPTSVASPASDDAWHVMGEILAYTALIVVGVITLPITLPLAVVMSISEAGNEKDRLVAQRQLAVHMEAAQVERLLGPPTARFCLGPILNDVFYYRRPDMKGLWLGIDQGQLVWLRFGKPDRWLADLTEQQRDNGKSCR